MKKIWFDEAWEEYLYWQTQDKKTIKRINALLKDIERDSGADGLMRAIVLFIVSMTVFLKSFHAKDIMRIEKKGDCYGGSSLFRETRSAQDGKDHVHI